MNSIKTGQLIGQCRREKGMTQKELAEKLHVTVQAVSKWERGLNFPDISLLEPLAAALDLSVSQLLSGGREEEPKEELVRESLRTFSGQWRRSLRRWRWLFALTAAMLLVLVLTVGRWWVREQTEWLPQTQTVVQPLVVEGLEQLVADADGRSVLMYDVTLADTTKKCTFQMELWTHEGLTRSYVCSGLEWPQDGPPPPRQAPLVFSYKLGLEEDPAALEFGMSFCGAAWEKGAIPNIPNAGGAVAVSGLSGQTVVPNEGDGAVLASFSLDNGAGYVRPGWTGTDRESWPEQGQVCVLLRMLCQY